MTERILIITENLNPPFDEGIKKTVYNLCKLLESQYTLNIICRTGIRSENCFVVHTNKLYFSRFIYSHIQVFKPKNIIYFPFASATFASYLRFFVLSQFAPRSKPILICLQDKPIKIWHKTIIKFIKPKNAVTSSSKLHSLWASLKINSKLIPIFSNLSSFKPINKDQLIALRKKHDLPLNDIIIIHMGHLNPGRNLESLITIQKPGFQIVILISSSTPEDAKGPAFIKQNLVDEGIIVIDRYIEKIEEYYQLADIYVFPVEKSESCIDLPLSILEARACGKPVLTTNFGSISLFLGKDFNNIYYSDPKEFARIIDTIINDRKTDRNNTGVNNLNDRFLEYLHRIILR